MRGGSCLLLLFVYALTAAPSTNVDFSAAHRHPPAGREEFRDAAMVFWYELMNAPSADGLYCTFLNGENLQCNGNHFTFGASADSTYEYMLKQWILSNGTDTVSMQAAHYHTGTAMLHVNVN